MTVHLQNSLVPGVKVHDFSKIKFWPSRHCLMILSSTWTKQICFQVTLFAVLYGPFKKAFCPLTESDQSGHSSSELLIYDATHMQLMHDSALLLVYCGTCNVVSVLALLHRQVSCKDHRPQCSMDGLLASLRFSPPCHLLGGELPIEQPGVLVPLRLWGQCQAYLSHQNARGRSVAQLYRLLDRSQICEDHYFSQYTNRSCQQVQHTTRYKSLPSEG